MDGREWKERGRDRWGEAGRKIGRKFSRSQKLELNKQTSGRTAIKEEMGI